MEGDLYGGLGVAPLDMRSLASSVSDAPPANTKDAVKVSYLVSSQFAGAVVHFFQTVESAQQGIDNVHRQRRTFGLVDQYDYSADIHTGVTRCVMVSKIEEVSLPSRDMRVLLGPFTEFDVLCQGSSMLDFIRTVGALYSPHAPGNPMILLQLEDKHQKALYSNSSQSTPPAVPMKSVRCRVFRGKLGGDAAPAAAPAAASLAAASAESASAARHHVDQPAPSSSSQQHEHEQEQQLQQPPPPPPPPPPPLGVPPPQASQQQQRPPPHAPDTVPTLPPGPPADIFSSRLQGDSASVVEAAAAAYGARTAGATGPAGQHELRMKVMRLEEELQLKARREAESEDSLRREVLSLRDELRRLSPQQQQQQQQQRQLAPPHAQPPQHQQPNPPPPAGPPPVWLEAYKQSPAPQQQQPPPTFSDPQQPHTPKVLSPSYLRAQGRVAETPPFARKPPPGSAPYQVGRPHTLPPGGAGAGAGAAGGAGAGSPGSIWGF